MANKLETTLEPINCGLAYAILTGRSLVYDRDKDGKKTSDTPIAHKFSIALFNRLTPLTVRIDGSSDPLPKVTEELIDASIRGDNGADFLLVQFTDCKVSIYAINGMVMTATAKGIQLVSTNK